MRKLHPRKKRRATPKTVLRLPDLGEAKSAVLNSLTSFDAQRGYRHAIDEFDLAWGKPLGQSPKRRPRNVRRELR